MPLCKKISTPPLPRTAPNKPFSPAAFGRLFYLRCALPCTPGCRTEYAVGRSIPFYQQRSVSAYEKHRNSPHPDLSRARQSCPHGGGDSLRCQGDGFTAAAASPMRPAAPPISPLKPPPAPSRWTRTTPSALTPLSDLTAAKSGYRTVRIEGIQIFAGQVTLAQPAMIPESRRKDQRHPGRAHRHPAAPFVRGQTAAAAHGPHGELHAPGAGQGDHPQKHHGASGQAGGLRPQRDRLLPGLYRQCRLQRGIPHLGGRK